jgi:hypothetical protein
MRLGGLQSRSGRRGEEKFFDLAGDSNFDPSVIQPVASRYTDCAIQAPSFKSSVLRGIFEPERGR